MMVGRMSAMSVFNSWDSNAEQTIAPNATVHAGIRPFIETADSIDDYYLAHPSDTATVADKGMSQTFHVGNGAFGMPVFNSFQDLFTG